MVLFIRAAGALLQVSAQNNLFGSINMKLNDNFFVFCNSSYDQSCGRTHGKFLTFFCTVF